MQFVLVICIKKKKKRMLIFRYCQFLNVIAGRRSLYTTVDKVSHLCPRAAPLSTTVVTNSADKKICIANLCKSYIFPLIFIFIVHVTKTCTFWL